MTKSQNNSYFRLLPEQQTMRANEDGTITVFIPIALKKRRIAKYKIIMPDIPQGAGEQSQPSAAILKAIGQAFRWKEMIDNGEVASMQDLAAKLKLNASYASRVLRLTLLAPDIIDALLNGAQPKQLKLADLLKPIPYDWNEQRVKYGFATVGERDGFS